MPLIPGKYYRYALYALELFLLCIIEGTPGLLPAIYLARPLLLVSAAVSAAAFELPYFSLFYAVACGLVIDVGTGGVMGLTSIILGFICYYESSWNDKYFKNNIYFVLLYSAVASVLVIGLKWFVFCFVREYDGVFALLRTHYVMRMLYTWAVTPIVYLLTMGVSKAFTKEKRKIKVRKRKRVPPSQRSGASRRRAKKTDY